MSKNNNFFSKDISDRERACFETGIKLGALYHILCGIPISTDKEKIQLVEKGIEASISCQPYVKSVKVTLNQDKIHGNKKTPFDYDEISGKIIQAELNIEYKLIFIKAKINWVEDLQYPLMYIEEINQKE